MSLLTKSKYKIGLQCPAYLWIAVNNPSILPEFDEFAKHLSEQIKVKGISQKKISKLFPSKTGGLTGCVWNWANGTNVPTIKQWDILKPLLDLSDEFIPPTSTKYVGLVPSVEFGELKPRLSDAIA